MLSARLILGRMARCGFTADFSFFEQPKMMIGLMSKVIRSKAHRFKPDGIRWSFIYYFLGNKFT